MPSERQEQPVKIVKETSKNTSQSVVPTKRAICSEFKTTFHTDVLSHSKDPGNGRGPAGEFGKAISPPTGVDNKIVG